ncbi:MAG: orotidine 5'-phosphate decarboxylase / HUMPS family protein [archaeon]
MGIFKGRILRVDLTKKNISEEYAAPKDILRYIGGRGLAAKILIDELDPKTDPLSEKNMIILMAGPLTGLAPASGRCSFTSKSPLTGTIFDSNVGGSLGYELRKTGYDGVIITGRSDTPLYLEITDNKAELKDAKHLWTKTTTETTELLAKDKFKVACIGPAGENLVLYSSIIIDRSRAAGRGGLGAVLGSKKLKAIALKGTQKIEPANEFAFSEQKKRFLEIIRGHPVTGDSLGRFGTLVLMNPVNKHGILPINNFQKGFYDNVENISGETMQKYLTKKTGCALCPIMCGRDANVEGVKTHGPEYESTWALTVQCGHSDAKTLAIANNLCNELGLDTITTGSTIGFAMECSDKGLIKEKITFGDTKIIPELIEKIAYKKDIGALLSEGTKRMGKKLGATDFAINVKGLEIPAYDPRGVKGQALSYMTSNRGGCHLRAYMIPQEVLSSPRYLDNLELEDKARKVRDIENIFAVMDSLVMCKFTTIAVFETFDYEIDIYARMLTTATGMYFDEKELKKAGERIWNLERLFNTRAGFTKEDDRLPKRFEEPMPEGPAEGETAKMDSLLSEYYTLRGWDASGIPEEKKLTALSIDFEESWPKKIVSLNHESLEDAISDAKKNLKSGDWIEVASPLVKSQGVNAIIALRALYPYKTIIADYKTMDTGYLEVEIAAQAGADIVTISSHAGNHTIIDAIGAAKKYGAKIMIDLFDDITRAKEVEKLGVDYIRVFKNDIIEKLSKEMKIPVASFIASKHAKLAVESFIDKEPKATKRTKTPELEGIWPKLQVALDLRNLKEALKLARGAKEGGAHWLEVGTPLVKSAGMDAVREIRKEHPDCTIVADLKTLRNGGKEVAIAARAGADIIGICGASENSIIKDAIRAAKDYNVKIMADLIAIKDPVARAKELEDMGADYIEFHISVDEQMRSGNAKIPFPLVESVAKAITIPMGVAGGMRADTAPLAIKSGAKIAVVGGSITRAADPKKASIVILKAIGR